MSNFVKTLGKITIEHLQRDLSDYSLQPGAWSVRAVKLLEWRKDVRMFIYIDIIRAGCENVFIQGILSRMTQGIMWRPVFVFQWS